MTNVPPRVEARRMSLFAVLSLFILAPLLQAGPEGLVYLKVQDVRVSSFDESPGGWAPPPDSRAVVDGDLKTRWASKPEKGQWFVLNFSRPKTITELVLHWERAYAASYALEISENGSVWQRLQVQKKGAGGTERLTFKKPVKATYLRLSVLARVNDQWGVSLWEAEAYGPRDRNPGEKTLGEVFPWRTGADTKVEPVEIPLEKPLPSPGSILPKEFHRGINYTSWHETDIGTPISDRTLAYLKERGVGHIALLTTWFQKDPAGIDIYPQNPKGGQTPTDNAIKHAINAAHALGMKVMLKPHLDIEDGTYRGDFYPAKGWFPAYAKFIMHYARLAREFNVEMYCIGVELKGATTWEQEKNWRDLIKEVRGVYKGPLTYAANWDEHERIDFWDALDFIGIDAYFPLTNNYNADLHAIELGWGQRADEIEHWLQEKKLQKPVLFTELGYPSVDGANVQPWVGVSQVKDRQEQANCIEASFRVLSKRPWFRGFYWWHYFPTDRPLAEDLTLRGKLAEEIMTNWHKKLSPKGETKK